MNFGAVLESASINLAAGGVWLVAEDKRKKRKMNKERERQSLTRLLSTYKVERDLLDHRIDHLQKLIEQLDKRE